MPNDQQVKTFQEKVQESLEGLRFCIHMSHELAAMKKALYDAYVLEGFTEQQALELVK